jgi:hypothetical protein
LGSGTVTHITVPSRGTQAPGQPSLPHHHIRTHCTHTHPPGDQNSGGSTFPHPVVPHRWWAL